MADDLLQMLATETDRRAPAMVEGIAALANADEADPEAVEAIRIEAHGLKGAAMVVGQPRLAELGEKLEIALVRRQDPGTIDGPLAAVLTAGVEALRQGARAVATGDEEPPSLAEALDALADDSPSNDA